MCIGREQVAVEGEAQEFVVEAEGVVADADGARLIHPLVDTGDGFELAEPRTEGRRSPAVGQHGLGGGDHVRSEPDVQDMALDFGEGHVRADGGELKDLIEARIEARGFDVVEQETVHAEKLGLSASAMSSGKAMHSVSLNRFRSAPTSGVPRAWLKKVRGENSR